MEGRKILNNSSVLVIILLAALLRIIPHPANIAPVAAMALFGGAYLNKKYALIVPLCALFVSDLFIGFHSTMPYVYGSFLLTGAIGVLLKKKRNVQTVTVATFVSSLLFFIITNFGVWVSSPLYEKTIEGLIQCYYLALPFFRNTVIGDFFYTGVLFGGYELLKTLSLSPLFNKKS